jgi:hypothetical protein
MPFPLRRAFAAIALTCAAGTPAFAAQPTPDSTYDADDTWLCRPGRQDLCSGEQAVTAIGADGKTTVTTLKPDPNAPVDCFYVYPTISTDPNPNSSLKAGPGEQRAVQQQFAPFASVCRPFAPMYRQVTLAGLRNVMTGAGTADSELATEDVRAAFRHYLARNKDRGFVLIGHSQGSRKLLDLLQRDIEGKPEQKRLVGAILAGFNVLVPQGADVGGTLKSVPTCTRPGQAGCVVTFATFRADSPPPANARFGRSTTAGSEVACTDPVALSRMELRPMLWRTANLLGQPAAQGEWQQMTGGVASPFVDLPGMLKAACVKDGPNHYLALTIDAAARGTRAPDIPGDIVAQGRRWDDWGLHLADMNLVMGNLLEIVRRQAAAWKP